MQNDKGRVISNYGGWQSSDIKPGDSDQIDNLVKLLNDEMKTCAQQVGLKECAIYNIWITLTLQTVTITYTIILVVY